MQLAQMSNPKHKSLRSGVEKFPFAQQNIHVSLDSTVGNTIIYETKINIKYSFVKSNKNLLEIMYYDGSKHKY